MARERDSADAPGVVNLKNFVTVRPFAVARRVIYFQVAPLANINRRIRDKRQIKRRIKDEFTVGKNKVHW